MSGVLAALLCAATWATGSVLMKNLSRRLDPFTLNAPRSLVGGLAMLALTLATGRQAAYATVTPDRLFFMIASMVIGGAIGDSFYVVSLSKIGVSQAFPLSSTYPALTLLFGLLFLHEHITWHVVLGLVLVLGGILVMSRSAHKLNGHLTREDKRKGVLFALLAALLWAISSVLVAPGVTGLDPIMVASIRVPVLSLVLWGTAGVRGTLPKLGRLSVRDWVVIIVGGLIGWGLGSALFVWSVSELGATRSAILTSTSPLFALPLSVLFLQEKVNWLTLVGTALTVAGIVLVS
jgi:drug/metabolite transporter (DMT)-like permease